MRPLRRSDLVTRTVDGEIVILDLANGAVHRLNATATSIWNDCDGKSTALEIATRLGATVQRRPDEVIGDVSDAIGSLQRLGLLERHD